MLVLSRKRFQSIWIGPGEIPPEGLWITVNEIRGDLVRLGISAPDHIEVHREEIHQKIERERRAAQ